MNAVGTLLRLPPELRLYIFRYLLVPSPRCFLCGTDPNSHDDPPERPHTTILRANRQIYMESSAILYSELAIILRPGDIVCLRTPWDDIARPSENIWRHNPVDGIGEEGPIGSRTYSTPVMGGLMDPHVFARFKRIELQLCFDLKIESSCRTMPELFVDSNYEIPFDQCARLSSFIKETHILQDLSTVLANSPEVSSLRTILSIETHPGFNPGQELPEHSDEQVEQEISWLT